MKSSAIVAVILWSLLSMGQNAPVPQANGSVGISIPAQKPYQLLAGQQRLPVLTLQCSRKGKKSVHILTFSAGGNLSEDNLEMGKHAQVPLKMVLGEEEEMTTWVPYGDTGTFAYYGKTEPERVRFLQSLLTSNSPTLAISFTPFLTGMPITSVFDLQKLRAAIDKHPECSLH